MIKRQNEFKVTAEYNANGEEKMYLTDLSDFKIVYDGSAKATADHLGAAD